MAAYNLVRNARVFFTTNVDPVTGIIPSSGATISNTNTFELFVMNGFSFKQSTQQATISLNEAGNTPTRGQRTFNTSLDPVEFSFSTYLRPAGTTTVTADESILWNAIATSNAIDSTGQVLATIAGFTRAASSNIVGPFTCTAFNMATLGIAVGDTINVTGVLGTDAMEWNMPAVITARAGTDSACTGLTLAYITAPAGAATAPATAPTTITLRKGAWTTHPAVSPKTAYGLSTFADSNRNQLQKFGLYFSVDGILYAVDGCALDQAAVDFGLDGIAMAAWTGKGTALRQLNSGASTATLTGTPAVFSGTGNATGTAKAASVTANYITNKLATVQLIAGIQGTSTVYTLAITGGSLNISNNISYVTPENLGVVNKAIGYFTGARSISGNLTAYLKTGTNASAQLLNDIVTASAAETKFRIQLEVGGSTNTTRIEFDMDGCMLQVPTVETGDLMSTTINFTAQGYDPLVATNGYDLGQTNDLAIRYFSGA